MFLTKKGFLKILIMAIVYFLLGSICIGLWFVYNSMEFDDNFLLKLGIFVYVFCIIIIFWGRNAEGKDKLINLGNKLVRKELKPAEFIKKYELLKNSDDLIIKKPSIDVLKLVAIAYDSLDEKEKALETVDEMIAVASEKKKAYVNLVKVSFLFAYDKKEEAEVLFNEIQKQKVDIMSMALVDMIFKSDRAMAMGDYKTVEAYNLKLLDCNFPKHDNLGNLTIHYMLGKVYEKMGEKSKANAHYQYCVDFGGETAIKTSAIEKLQHIK